MSKGKRIGELEELIMLAIGGLGENAYGVTIAAQLDEVADRSIPMGAIYATLNRMERKGFVVSKMGEPTPERGGRRKKFYKLSREGLEELAKSRRIRESMWENFNNLAKEFV